MSHDMRQVVRSPEQVELMLPLAGPTSRILAYAIDWAILLLVKLSLWVGVFFGLTKTASWLRGIIDRLATGWTVPEMPGGAVLYLLLVIWLVGWVLDLGYFVFLESATGGQSVGKRIMKLRVVRDDGFPIELRHSVIRNLLRAVDELPGTYVVGLVATIVSDQGKRLGDVAAGTIVVRLDRPLAPGAMPALPAEGRPEFTFAHAQLARVGQTEVALALETLRRIDALDPERRAQVLERTVTALCAHMEYPPVAADERAAFLRAVLEAVGVA
jgi:uncharacterized RDD family membrane protein YckC